MSLATAVVQNDFIITGSDTAVIYFEDPEERKGMMPTEYKSEKTKILTTKVILLATGDSILTTIVEAELESRVDLNDDLEHCRKVLKEVITDMKEKKIPNINFVRSKFKAIFSDTRMIEKEEVIESLKYMNNKAQFSVVLVGFNNDGTSGAFDANEDMLLQPKDDGGFYPTAIIGHHPDNTTDKKELTKFQKELFLPTEYRTADNFIKAISVVHAMVSHESPVNVSSECIIRFLYKDEKGIINHGNLIIDTLPLYERLGLPHKGIGEKHG